MFRNILVTTFRYFLKHKAYSFTNIFGLAIGLATCILIFLFVQDELSYDQFHRDAENIYRLEPHWVGQGEDSHWAASQGSIIPAVTARYPEIVSGLKFHKSYGTAVISYEENTFREYGILMADSNFFDLFSFELLQGNPKTCLTGPEKIVLTETTAKRYFGDKDPMGEMIKSDDRTYMVSGIAKDVPENSHIQFNMIISLDDLRTRWPGVDQPGPSTFYSYVKLQNKESLKSVKAKLDKDIWEIYGFIVSGDSANIPEGYTAEFIFNPVTDIHLNGHA